LSSKKPPNERKMLRKLGSQEAGKQGSKDARKPGSWEAGKQGSKDARKPGSWDAGKQGCSEAWKLGCWEARNPKGFDVFYPLVPNYSVPAS
jgi:hypothetical protein